MLQIRGLVKAAQKAKDRLKAGIKPQDASAFQEFIATSVESVESLCADANIKPSSLSTRSRQAYYFLKSIDLQNLPLVCISSNPVLPKTIGIKKIKTQQRAILNQICKISNSLSLNSQDIQALAKIINQIIGEIEQNCTLAEATPVNLTHSSRQVYAWLKFLSLGNNLESHLKTTQRLIQIASRVCQNHCEEIENLSIDLTNIAGLYRARRLDNDVSLTICEGFLNASDQILEALVRDSLLGKTKETTTIIRDFAYTEEYSSVLLELDLIVEVVTENAAGKHYDLNRSFNKINNQFFGGSLDKPRLSWSHIPTYRQFGHYEPSRDRVVISLTLDDVRIPEFVVEFVLYHELLHKYHGAKFVNGRHLVHTLEFRQDERKFPYHKEAEAWLSKLAMLKPCTNTG
ncbi:M48 family metallopeptidase [Calothrix sp. PCC 6303]|uniref:M48 family metallopeptidase n=1 Tax=Calothrix sp. PCC 6303 TaxID=1170562 RepID=UPI0002A02579|nr:M48 family metallopeptidase [Calothrix sp. PCC 6303]AFY99833.1 hypothetical protein Cal6303_0766 [Calothrix sp. PCC 6303]